MLGQSKILSTAILDVIVAGTPLRTHVELDNARQHVNADNYRQPVLLLQKQLIREKARRFIAAMPRVHPHFALKCNPLPEIISIFQDEGVGFEIASKKELELLLAQGVNPATVFYSNPIKSNQHLQFAVDQGVEWYVVDSVDELRKVHSAKSDAKFYLRFYTSNEGAVWELSSKFGASDGDVADIIGVAQELAADLGGVTFHAGSQCLNIQNWVTGIRSARKLFDQLEALNFNPRLLNIGGGYPVPLGNITPEIEAIGAAISAELEAFGEHVKVIAEPGRYLVADAGHFVCRVVGTASRGEQRWLYLDAGFYGGLIEMNDLPFILHTDRSGPTRDWHMAGPTCDSIDVFKEVRQLPAGMQADDFVYIEAGGAYTNSTACEFNGFAMPEVRFI
jgi:ornithine decarboxylase